jgi:hypothetical protein
LMLLLEKRIGDDLLPSTFVLSRMDLAVHRLRHCCHAE